LTTRVAHVLAWFWPESWGGTEQYVHGLSLELTRQGVESWLLVPESPGGARRYAHDGVDVCRYETRDGAFLRLLQQRLADIVHVHSWTPDCGMPEVRAAQEIGARVVVTIHVPSLTCPRGTLLRFGTTPCDGRLEVRRCSACWMHLHGLDRVTASALSLVPPGLGARLADIAPSPLSRALGATANMRERRGTLEELGRRADRVVAVSAWLNAALAESGIPANRLVCSRQGVDSDWPAAVAREARVGREDALRVLFVGRWHPSKGQLLLVEALRRIEPGVALRLTLCCPEPANEEAEAFRAAVLGLAGGDPRISVCTARSRQELASHFARADVLAAPSQWFETGPLSVMEALASGVPVLGSDLGGIAECLAGSGQGWLVRHDDIDAWARQLSCIARGAEALPQIPRPLPGARTMTTVGEEMLRLYRELLPASTPGS
jgi:glycosyltransferase involved in cell wall biosynthesis